jgi:hypothetical protein
MGLFGDPAMPRPSHAITTSTIVTWEVNAGSSQAVGPSTKGTAPMAGERVIKGR